MSLPRIMTLTPPLRVSGGEYYLLPPTGRQLKVVGLDRDELPLHGLARLQDGLVVVESEALHGHARHALGLGHPPCIILDGVALGCKLIQDCLDTLDPELASHLQQKLHHSYLL